MAGWAPPGVISGSRGGDAMHLMPFRVVHVYSVGSLGGEGKELPQTDNSCKETSFRGNVV